MGREGAGMKRREFITLLGGAAAWPLVAQAQQPSRVARIGFLRYASPHEKQFNAFRDGLRALGYVEGRNIVIEQRYAAGAVDRLGPLAAELVRLNVDVIVVDGSAAAKAAKAATVAIPVVFSLATDPEAEGLVASMARPSANLTGLTMSVGYQLAGKRVELLKDITPDLSRLAVLGNPGNLTTQPNVQDIERVAGALGVTVRTFEARNTDDLPRAFAAMVAWRADGVNTLNDAMLFSQRERVVRLTLDSNLAGVHPEAEFPEAGGLLSYGPSLSDLFRRAASYVDKVLKGIKPAELAIEQPSRFELVVNLKAARTLGLTISRDFLLRADEVIE
jgi:putative tryptophan/tyrosine transport system substrate-binding protein